MANTILWRGDDNRFEVAAVESIFRTVEGFSSVRLDEPGGALIEAKYSDRGLGERVLVRLSSGSDAISITDASQTSFQVAIIIQQHIDAPLRVVDTDYTFDLNLSECSSVDEFANAVDLARQDSNGSSAD